MKSKEEIRKKLFDKESGKAGAKRAISDATDIYCEALEWVLE